jgi:hypothetical protein
VALEPSRHPRANRGVMMAEKDSLLPVSRVGRSGLDVAASGYSNSGTTLVGPSKV